LEQNELPGHEASPSNPPPSGNFRLIVGITGASGSIYGWRLLEKLRSRSNIEVHLILSRAGERTSYLELNKQAADFRALTDCWYPVEDISCRLASGSFRASAMVIAPCSIHTMSSIAAGISSNLILRAADVTLKQRRPLVLMVRETPLHLGHLRSMAVLAEIGAIIAPPVPAFYHRPQSVEELVDDSVDRILDLLGLAGPEVRRWDGPHPAPHSPSRTGERDS
jgi:4-hydroxy-3-polyprenylbenzoate decarboxylase